MPRIEDVTLARLLDYIEGHLHRWLPGRDAMPGRAYAADAAGEVTSLAFPVPDDEAGRQALAAILQSEMTKRGAVLSVLAIEASLSLPGAEGRDRLDCVVLEGEQIRPVRRTEVRLLAIERQGRRIAALRRLETPAAGQPRPSSATQRPGQQAGSTH
ncbi:hypothetical protein [Paracraurococcus lichenis]|uniref:Uncharacterized protein n=1 Tax=Paracraurococcus lichenis TaxID=3064888 RepID=A0ABT9ED53_9PROT|nr:hypothetical protein [Paracraurococcus sp. LOR1-02]MDO9714124.1 hypothetical protein [Paracraurococcus sp. LOR1-02]